jgi:hypothetical protein
MKTLRAWAVRVGLWLARWGGWTPPPPVEVDRWGLPETLAPLVALAHPLIAAQDADSAEGTSGEYKRHQVYARLLKTHPETPKRDLALAIELAVRLDE